METAGTRPAFSKEKSSYYRFELHCEFFVFALSVVVLFLEPSEGRPVPQPQPLLFFSSFIVVNVPFVNKMELWNAGSGPAALAFNLLFGLSAYFIKRAIPPHETHAAPVRIP